MKKFFTLGFAAILPLALPGAVLYLVLGFLYNNVGVRSGECMKALNETLKKRVVCVFVPAAATPVSGFVIYGPREDVIPLPLTVEEAMRIIISAGVLHPGHQAIGPASIPAGPAQHRPLP